MKEIIKHYKILLSCDKFVVTGSYAMSLLGIYKNKPADLDIVLLNPTKETTDLLDKLMKESPADTKPYNNNMFIFKHGDTKIDVFVTNNEKDAATELKVDDFFVSRCDTIVNAKKSYSRLKDWIQLRKISQMFFKQSDFEAFLDKQ